VVTGAEGVARRGREDRASAARWPWSLASTLLGAAMLASAALWIALGSKLTFILDDWVVILYRHGFDADAFLQPDNEHLIAGPIAIWQLLLHTVGMGSVIPFRVVSTAIFLLGALLLFVWIRRRLGEWPALVATIPVLFLGAAFDDFLWFSSITFLGAMAGGLGMLVALDRRDRLGDGLACACLTASMLFSSLWLAFAAGAVVDIALRRGERAWWRRAYVVAVPLVLYVIWRLVWGDNGESSISLHNVGTTPLFVLDSIAAALGALFGLAGPVENIVEPSGLDWGQPLAVAAVALAIWRMYRMERIPRSLWVVIAVALAFWVLSGVAVKPGRVPWASRYQYPSVAFLLLVAAELLRGVDLRRRWLAVAAAIFVAVSTAGSAHALDDAYSTHRARAELIRADLAALEITRYTIEPNFFIDEENGDTGFAHVDAGSYLHARDAFGSPADSEAELLDTSEPARFAADKVLVAALGFGLAPLPASALPEKEARPAKPSAGGPVRIPAGGCVAVPGGTSQPVLSLPPAGVTIEAGAEPVTDIRMRRFATEQFSVDFLEGVEPGRAVELRLPLDLARTPWKMQLEGGAATACGLRPQAS
jgi:hypothetical protein